MQKNPAFEMSRRRFLLAGSAAASSLCLGAVLPQEPRALPPNRSQVALSDLPRGAAPQPLKLPHFPDRLHAFVWRNWSLVTSERMAMVVGARTRDIDRIGRSLGLTKASRTGLGQQTRSYITVIKRNWHLLPYDQLLELLGWPAEKLAYTLREDDFLYVKLGNHKPACEPLLYSPPAAATLAREREIAQVMRDFLVVEETGRTEALFAFVNNLAAAPKRLSRPTPNPSLKFCYSYFALYGDPLLAPDANPYPEGYLARLADIGVTGVWLQAVLYKLAPFPWSPGLSAQYEARLSNLRQLVANARKYGMQVFLYLNEPRSMPLAFFTDYPELRGVTEGAHATLCTSHPAVGQYLRDASASICRAVPELGGFFTITASENLTNCWSHGQGSQCARCARRSPAEVIAGVSSLLQEGIVVANSQARLIAWDWGWDDRWAAEAIGRLPRTVALMSVSEWGLPLERGGVRSEVGEYSISAIGPGPRARRHWELAAKHGLKTLAKIQAGNTWELSSVPHIPAVANVAQHAERLRQAGITELMLGWTLGGYPSPNLEVVSAVMAGSSATEAMRQVAERRFGKPLAPGIIRAWHQFSAAFSEFPFHIGVLYSGPQQLGPANLLWSEPTHYAASMVGFPYDDLDAWRSIFPAEIFIQQLRKVADGFFQALEQIRREDPAMLEQVTPAQKRAFEQELRVAEAAALHFRSAANQAQFVLSRRVLAHARSDEVTRLNIQLLEGVLQDELRLAQRLYQLQTHDSRLGFEASNQYFYVPLDLAEKTLNCRYLLDHWLPQLRAG